MIGLDWCLTVPKNMIKEGIRRVLYSVNKETGGCAIVGVVGITPQYDRYEDTKFKTVTYNRCLQDAVRECEKNLLLHLHFLERGEPGKPATFIQPLEKYFYSRSEFTITGGFVLRQMLLKSIGVIPQDGQH